MRNPRHVCAHATVLAALFSAVPAAAETIELKSGDKIEADVIEHREDVVVVEHPVFGRVEIPRDDIVVEEKEVKRGLFGSPVLRGWTRELGAGFAGATGNAESASINAGLDISRETDGYRGSFMAQYFYSSDEGATATSQFFARYIHDFLLPRSRFFITLGTRYDFDDFQSWRNRISAQLAPGYDIVENETWYLRTNIGVGVAHETGRSLPFFDSRTRPEGVVSLAGKWRTREGQTFTADTTYFLDFDDIPEFRLISNARYGIDLGAVMEGLGLQIGIRNEYDSLAEGDKNRFNYFGNLTYKF